MFKIIGAAVVYGFALYGLAKYLGKPIGAVTKVAESGPRQAEM
jgi:hypothetical protein